MQLTGTEVRAMCKDKTAHQLRIEDFMTKAGQKIPESPTVPPKEVLLLRAKLIMEECLEVLEELDVELWCNPFNAKKTDGIIDYFDASVTHLSKLIKELIDLSVVTNGKLIKPPGFQPPDIQRLLDLQTKKGENNE